MFYQAVACSIARRGGQLTNTMPMTKSWVLPAPGKSRNKVDACGLCT